MELGMVGLGKMGLNMTKRLMAGGHKIFVSDLNSEAVKEVEAEGAVGANSLKELVGKMSGPRAIWAMVPSGKVIESVVEELAELLDPGDIVIDGGNSNYKESINRSEELGAKGIHFIDVGTSGGVWGLAEGYSLMVGGDSQAVESIKPVLETLAPATDRGWGHVGPSGSGHFVKMVHNGIEYGMMQAYAEGFGIMNAKEEFGLDLHQVSEIWKDGSVVRSWLLDLTSNALKENPTMDGIAPYVSDSGEGRWTVFEAIDLDVPAPVITLSLLQRLRSRDETAYYDRLLSAMRNQFGGHAIKKETP
jgi:6-phosphogluconate dehydrogenase